MIRTPLRFAVVFALLGCGDLPPPVLEGIEPANGPSDAPTSIVLVGRDFHRVLEEDGAEIRSVPWSGTVGGVPLESLVWRSTERIDAVVAAGLPPGAHDVVVGVEGHAEARLPGGFTVTAP